MDSNIFLSQRRPEIQRDAGPGRSARSVDGSGRAAIAIAVLLIVQLSLPGLSDFRPTAYFGMLCAVGLFAGQRFELLPMPGCSACNYASRG